MLTLGGAICTTVDHWVFAQQVQRLLLTIRSLHNLYNVVVNLWVTVQPLLNDFDFVYNSFHAFWMNDADAVMKNLACEVIAEQIRFSSFHKMFMLTYFSE